VVGGVTIWGREHAVLVEGESCGGSMACGGTGEEPEAVHSGAECGMYEIRESSMYACACASTACQLPLPGAWVRRGTSLDGDRTPNSAYVLRKVGAQETVPPVVSSVLPLSSKPEVLPARGGGENAVRSHPSSRRDVPGPQPSVLGGGRCASSIRSP
jgi:hypothetical protein